MLEEIADGARYAIGTPLISLVLGLILSVSLFVINFNTLVPLFARDVLHEGARTYGLLMASVGLGAVIGALVLALIGPGRPALSVVITGGIVVSGGLVALAAARDFWLAAGTLFIIGCAQIVFTASCNSTLQITAPDRLRGRIMSLYAFVFVGSSPIGSFLVGVIAETLGVPAACAFGGGGGLVFVTLLAVWWKRRGAGAPRAADS
jgi:predicted MFS family arabinose efflux permease